VGSDILCRLSFISPRQGEIFYLQVLLLHKAADNYKELHTVNDITYDTFLEATTQLGLFAYIDEVENWLQEAVAVYYAPYHLRFIYAQLIVHIPAPVLELWEKYDDELSANHTELFATADHT
jgi:hypothetical protein